MAKRIRQIRMLAEQVSSEQQTKLLQDVLLTLDATCLELIQLKQSDAIKSTAEPPDPKELLQALLSKRVKIPKQQNQRNQHQTSNAPQVSKKNYASYIVKNAKLSGQTDAKTLKVAFAKLASHRNPKPKLMKQARRAYIENLEKSVKETLFEERYFELQQYIDVVSETPDLGELEQRFTDIMKEQCGLEFDRIMQIYNNQTENKLEHRYLDRLIYSAAQSRANQGMQCFSEALYLVEMFSQMVSIGKDLDGVYTAVHILSENGTEYVYPAELPPYTKRKKYFQELQNFFVHYWIFAGHSCPVDEMGHFVDIDHLVHDFIHGAQQAATFLHKGSTLVRSEADTKELLQFCEDCVMNADAIMPMHEIANLSFPILMMAILQTLQRIVTDSVPSLLKDFSTLQQIQKCVLK